MNPIHDGLPRPGQFSASWAKTDLAPSKVPTDPEERKKWATAKAIEQGWIQPQREPGSGPEEDL